MTQLKSDLQKNYRTFIEGILDSGKVWALKSEEGWVFCESSEYEDADVIPFWSDEANAKVQCSEEWAANVPEAIELDHFIDAWLSGMDEDGVLAGPNWNAEMEGLEIEPGDLANKLLAAADAG